MSKSNDNSILKEEERIKQAEKEYLKDKQK